MEEFLRRAIGLKMVAQTVPDDDVNDSSDLWEEEIVGLVAVGGTMAVFKVKGNNVLKLEKNQFVFPMQINEFPLLFRALDGTPAYDLGVLNEKLSQLVNNEYVQDMISVYDDLTSQAIDSLVAHDGSEENLRVIRGLGAFALTRRTAKRIRSMLQSESSAVSDDGAKAKATLRNIMDKVEPVGGGRELGENPLAIWLGAKSEGFIEYDEFPLVSDYLHKEYRIQDWMFEQCGAIVAGLLVVQAEHGADQFMDFCGWMLDDDQKLRTGQQLAFRRGFSRCGAKVLLKKGEPALVYQL